MIRALALAAAAGTAAASASAGTAAASASASAIASDASSGPPPPLTLFAKAQRTVLPWAAPLQTVAAPDAATVAAACLNFSSGPAPPPPCAWSAQLPNTWLSSCASGAGAGAGTAAVNCIHFDALADAQAACAADADCGGVTSQNDGAPPWELRRGPAPQPSPTNESSYVIENAGACRARPACNAFDTTGRLFHCPGGRCDCDADASFCARGRDIFSADPAVGFGADSTDLWVLRGAPVPPEWAARVASGAVLYASPEPQTCYMPEIGNGHIATAASWASLHIGGLFNGACGSTHKATLSSPVAYSVTGGATLVGSALDMESGAFLRRWALPGGAAIEARIWAHRARKRVVVADFTLLPNGSSAPGPVVVPLANLFDPRNVAGAGNGCSSGFTSDFEWSGPAGGAAPQTWAGVTTLASDAGQRPNVSIALDAPPPNVSLSAAQPTARLIAAFASSIDFAGGAGSAADVAALAAADYASASAASLEGLWAEHVAAWAELLVSGVDVAPASADPGDVARAADIAAHANASRYFLFSSSRGDSYSGISPGGIASCSYNGAIFMDQDWWMQPPLVLLQPELGAALLEYRFLSIPVMQTLAKLFGFGSRNGAMAAWTAAYLGNAFGCCSATGGYEDCLEHHVTGDVSFSALQFFAATGNLTWLELRGYPLLAATADYHLARVSPAPPFSAAEVPADAEYHVLGTLPIDEWCVDSGCGCETPGVNDDAQMNGVTKASLLGAAMAARALGIDEPRAALWQAVGDAVVLLFNASGNHHWQFDSPTCPDGFGGSHYSTPHTVCPEDVNMLTYPLGDLLNISDATARADMELFAPITCRENAGMTTPMHTITWLQLGEQQLAMAEFNRSMHAACYGDFLVRNEVDKHADVPGGHFDNSHFLTGDGGFLQALMNGFGGLRVTAAGLALRKPYLPDSVGELRLRNLAWRGGHVTVTIAAAQGGSGGGGGGGGAAAQAVGVVNGPPLCLIDAAGQRQQTLASGGAAFELPAGFAYPGLLQDGAC
jgi:trehalose/maltose hydrolase-like predicted phosphorylase